MLLAAMRCHIDSMSVGARVHAEHDILRGWESLDERRTPR